MFYYVLFKTGGEKKKNPIKHLASLSAEEIRNRMQMRTMFDIFQDGTNQVMPQVLRKHICPFSPVKCFSPNIL